MTIPAERERVDRITAEIIDAMLDGHWIVGRSARELAKRESVEQSTAERWAAGAARSIRLELNVEDVRLRILTSIDLGLRKALGAETEYETRSGEVRRCARPDLKAMCEFLRLQSEIHGLVGRGREAAVPQTEDVEISELAHLLAATGRYRVEPLESSRDGEASQVPQNGTTRTPAEVKR